MNTGAYPAGCEGMTLAPWNEEWNGEERRPIEVDMTVYAYVKIPITIKTDEYDEYGGMKYLHDTTGLAEEAAKDAIPENWEYVDTEDVTVEAPDIA